MKFLAAFRQQCIRVSPPKFAIVSLASRDKQVGQDEADATSSQLLNDYARAEISSDLKAVVA